MSVEQIAARLDNAFRLLTGGSQAVLPRQQTLKATIDWSYNLLSPKERLLLHRLSVFAGGWTLEAAEAVCADVKELCSEERVSSFEVMDLLAQLVDKSLVIAEPGEREPLPPVGDHPPVRPRAAAGSGLQSASPGPAPGLLYPSQRAGRTSPAREREDRMAQPLRP